MTTANNQTTAVLRRWRIPGQQTDVFRSDNPSWNVKNSTYWVEDGSYLKVKNITLSYDITSPKLKRINTRASSLTSRFRTSSPGPTIRVMTRR